MKIQVIMETEKIPRRFHFLMASVVKRALTLSNPALLKEMYEYKGVSTNKSMRPFTSACFLNKYTLENDEFIIHNDVQLTISSSHMPFMLNLYNGLLQLDMIEYKSYKLQLTNIRVLPEKLPTKSRVLFRTISPLVIKNRYNEYLNIDHSTYVEELNYAANECVKAIEERQLYEPLSFTPVVMHKKVVQFQHEKFKKLNAQHILYVNAYEGTFLLEGHPADVAFLAQNGLGMRRSLLCGCIEMVNE